MQINPVSNGYNTSFNATVRRPLLNEEVLRVTVQNNKNGNIKRMKVGFEGKEKYFEQKWPNISYERILTSDFFAGVCSSLGLNSQEEFILSDAVHEAYMKELCANDNNSSDILYPATPFSAGYPQDGPLVKQQPIYE